MHHSVVDAYPGWSQPNCLTLAQFTVCVMLEEGLLGASDSGCTPSPQGRDSTGKCAMRAG